jgi:hypothetical protein
VHAADLAVAAVHVDDVPRTRLFVQDLEDRWAPSTFTVLNTLDDGSDGRPSNLGHRAAIWCVLLVGLLASLLILPQPERPPHTEAANLTDFVEQLRQRGVQLHAISGARDQKGGRDFHVYLTEDPTATWFSMQSKFKTVECLHQWRGTVCAEDPIAVMAVEDLLADWGKNGCRIGKFLLFGDERVLRRIEEACR